MHSKPIDLLMVFPSGGDIYFTNYKYHLGSAYIIAYLRKHGYNVEQFISDDSYNVKEFVRKIKEYKPQVVGFTVYHTNFMQCALLSDGIKAYNSEIIILFGGPTPSVQSKEILETVQSVDICVRHEGEEIVLELIKKLNSTNFNLNQTDLSKIKGITFRKKNNFIINSDSNILLSNLSQKNYIDKYPSPYLSEVIPISKAFPTGILTARGCNQNCVYCNCAVMSKRNIFFHSIERVIEELQFISEYQKFIGPIPIYDDTFTILPTRAKKICEAIIENSINIPLFCSTRCDKVNEELLDLLKEAGFVTIGLSLESAVPRVLNTIGKVRPPSNNPSENYELETHYLEKLKNVTSYAKKIGIRKVFASIMVGLPGESLQDAKKTIQLINQLDIDFYIHNKFNIYKGTPIYQNHDKYGYKIKPMGKKNYIHTENSYPFDVNKIKISPKCVAINQNRVIDYDIIKILSMTTNQSNKKSFFRNVILNTDIIKPSLIKWIQENLAINGHIIQIYSNKLKHQKLHDRNRKTLYNEFSPTLFYQVYYKKRNFKTYTLKSERADLSSKLLGFPIKLKPTHIALEEYQKGRNDIPYLIGVDYSTIDTKSLYTFLIEVSKNKDIFNHLMESKPLPQFQQLCRWTSKEANCHTLETAIIGNDDSIRFCWYSKPIGKIGLSFQDIILKLKQFQGEIMADRNCSVCLENKTCIKCLFPFPFSSEEYCKCKKRFFTNKTAEMIDIFSSINAYVLRPVNILEF